MTVRRLTLIVLSLLAFACYCHTLRADAPLVVTFLDVGQGDCEWLKTPDGQDIVIDGGIESQGPAILSYLQSRGVTDIELMVLSHPDSDHVGGLVTLLQNMPVALVAHNGQTSTSAVYQRFEGAIQARAIPTVVVRAGQTFTWGPVTATVTHPVDPLVTATNDNSVTLRVSYGAVAFLFPGDISSAAERSILGRGGDVQAQVLKVAHHGSQYSSSAPFLAAVQPQVAVIGVGPNSYGHPAQEALDRLAAAGATVLRTDRNGTVTVTTDGVAWTVTTTGQPLTPCIGDPNGDSVVDVFDLVIVSRAYNASGLVSDPRADVNGDGVVNLYDLVLVATSYGCGGQRQPPPAPTATPTATVMPLRTPTPTAITDGQIEVTTWLSNSTPSQYSTVTVYGRITGAGVGIAGVPMHTTWHYKTTTSYCDGTSGSDGIASCSRYISGATKGYYVSIAVGFTYQGQQHYASTGFTPH
jgi:beta-lactamase superfamily II metal-dependent hydrolase